MKKIILFFIIFCFLLSLSDTEISQGEEELLIKNELPARLQLDEILMRSSTYFVLNNSTYLDIILESSDPIKLTLKSVPEMVTMRIEPILNSTSTQITLRGLVPLTTYYKYEDDYHNLTVFTADANGDYTYLQDLTRQHFVFIMPGSGSKFTTSSISSTDVKFIKNDATGGDCTSIGNWDSNTKTCTLTTDLSDTIQIDSDDITLDGNGHTLSGYGTGSGVHVFEKTNYTIKNFKIEKFADGISCCGYCYNNHGNSLITDNIIKNNLENGIWISDSNCIETLIAYNDILENGENGIRTLYMYGNITIISNNISDNSENGIFSSDNREDYIITDNIICSNTNGIRAIYGFDYTIKDNTISKNTEYGIASYSFMDNNLTNNIIRDNNCGISLCGQDYWPGSNNRIIDNSICGNDYGISMEEFGIGNFIYYNNLNNDHNAFEYLDAGSNQWDDGSIGNHWSDYDETCEGCIDIDDNGICDSVYNIPGGSSIDHYPIVHWIYKWIGEGSDGESAVTTSELQEAIYHWLNDIPVRGHILSTADLQNIINLWLSG